MYEQSKTRQFFDKGFCLCDLQAPLSEYILFLFKIEFFVRTQFIYISISVIAFSFGTQMFLWIE